MCNNISIEKKKLSQMDMKFSCALMCWNWCAICQPTLRKNLIKKLKVFNRCGIFQPILTNEMVRWKLGLRKGEKHKKEADQNGVYLVLLTLVTL